MSDLISRQDALDAISPTVKSILEGNSFKAIVILDKIRELPSAEPKKGKWIPHPSEREWDVCTACGTGCHRRRYGFNMDGTKYVTEYGYQYCPNCGASMSEGEEDG